MENLTIGNVAIATVIIGILDLVIVVLVRTETILKAVERIKGIIKLDYKNRAKRSDDEIRISKKHELVAKERVRTSFVTTTLGDCSWTWNWSKEFTPINIKGFCLGDYSGTTHYECNRPVTPYYLLTQDGEIVVNESGMKMLHIRCSDNSKYHHNPNRAIFEIPKATNENAETVFNEIISKSIVSERDLRIAKEINKLNWQFWK